MNALESFEILETANAMTQFDTPEYLIRICQFLRDLSFSSITVTYFSTYRQYTLYSYELFITIHFRNRIKFDIEKEGSLLPYLLA